MSLGMELDTNLGNLLKFQKDSKGKQLADVASEETERTSNTQVIRYSY